MEEDVGGQERLRSITVQSRKVKTTGGSERKIKYINLEKKPSSSYSEEVE